MRKNFCTKKSESITAKLLKKFFITAHADEGTEGTPAQPAPQVNYEELIAKARKEEKDKLYGQIKKLETDLATKTASINEYLITIGTLKAELESAKKSTDSGEAQKVIDLEEKIAQLSTELEAAKESTTSVSEEEIRAKVEAEIREALEAEYTVKNYKTEKLAEFKEDILPTFVELVQGSTVEELDAAIELAKNKTLETKKLLGLVDEEGKEIAKSKTTTKKSSPKTTNPPTGSQEDALFDEDYVRKLDPKSKEYAEWRVRVGLDKY